MLAGHLEEIAGQKLNAYIDHNRSLMCIFQS